MQYYFSKIIPFEFEEAAVRITEALKTQGFGVISEIDIKAKLNEKLGVEIPKYTILGACSPLHAYKAISVEEKIGLMLPCNVIVVEKDKNHTEISVVDPMASMMAIQNPELEGLAKEITEKLRMVMETLE
ncbi:MAG: DUF302 domain-containing protein [Bacteroidales bacterium]|nr:DUF302 domain-containing protein [Bacteroidales bacterium]